MRVHWFRHVPFEGLGSLEEILVQRDHALSATYWDEGQKPPGLECFDLLIVMGGPMGVGDGGEFPWLDREKAYIQKAIESEKAVLGICLGAQLIASAMGAPVRSNERREIGWFPLRGEASETFLAKVMLEGCEVFHWHGDSFEVPEGAARLGSTTACPNQGFILGEAVLGLQFHLETTRESLVLLIENCGAELDGSQYVQAPSEGLAEEARFDALREFAERLVDYFEKVIEAESSA